LICFSGISNFHKEFYMRSNYFIKALNPRPPRNGWVRAAAPALFLALVLGFSGCGGSDDDRESTQGQPAAPIAPVPGSGGQIGSDVPAVDTSVHLTLYVKSDGCDLYDGKTMVTPLQTVTMALAKVAAEYANPNNPWPEKNTVKKKSAEIVLLDPLTVTEAISITETDIAKYPPLILRANKKADGGSAGTDVSLTSSFGNSLITVGPGVTLTLRDITFTGIAGNTAALIKAAGGTLILETGALITGNAGGGAYVAGASNGAGGTLILEDGAFITGNTGGIGVKVDKGAFTMKGGTISNNGSANSGLKGTGVSIISGTFTMDGGLISGNKAGSSGGVDIQGAFIMNDGTISNNTGGVTLTSGTFTMNDGLISGNTGSGVSVQGKSTTFTMRGGTISGNETSGTSSGGGVIVRAGTFIMENGLISGNTAGSGGGVSVRSNEQVFTKTGGAIYGSSGDANANTARSGNGHAVIYNKGAKKRNTTAGPAVNLDTGTDDNWE
jgi:hypothetical protein